MHGQFRVFLVEETVKNGRASRRVNEGGWMGMDLVNFNMYLKRRAEVLEWDERFPYPECHDAANGDGATGAGAGARAAASSASSSSSSLPKSAPREWVDCAFPDTPGSRVKLSRDASKEPKRLVSIATASKVLNSDGDEVEDASNVVNVQVEKLGPSPFLEIRTDSGTFERINVRERILYYIDAALSDYFPALNEDLKRFAMPTLPADRACILRFIPEQGRPFMGPNVYATPPGAFTWFHQDGNGTVDSGHQSLTGLNEVIMLQRLGEEQKQAALTALADGHAYGLRTKAHEGDEKPGWPSQQVMNTLKDAKIAYSHLILYPGDYLHINKGRLHAFRKLATRSEATQCFLRRREDQEYLSLLQHVNGYSPLQTLTDPGNGLGIIRELNSFNYPHRLAASSASSGNASASSSASAGSSSASSMASANGALRHYQQHLPLASACRKRDRSAWSAMAPLSRVVHGNLVHSPDDDSAAGDADAVRTSSVSADVTGSAGNGASIVRASRPVRDDTCVSIAWDWFYVGSNAEALQAECECALDSAAFNRPWKTKGLAVVETAIQGAASYVAMGLSEGETAAPLPDPLKLYFKEDHFAEGFIPVYRFLLEAELGKDLLQLMLENASGDVSQALSRQLSATDARGASSASSSSRKRIADENSGVGAGISKSSKQGKGKGNAVPLAPKPKLEAATATAAGAAASSSSRASAALPAIPLVRATLSSVSSSAAGEYDTDADQHMDGGGDSWEAAAVGASTSSSAAAESGASANVSSLMKLTSPQAAGDKRKREEQSASSGAAAAGAPSASKSKWQLVGSKYKGVTFDGSQWRWSLDLRSTGGKSLGGGTKKTMELAEAELLKACAKNHIDPSDRIRPGYRVAAIQKAQAQQAWSSSPGTVDELDGGDPRDAIDSAVHDRPNGNAHDDGTHGSVVSTAATSSTTKKRDSGAADGHLKTPLSTFTPGASVGSRSSPWSPFRSKDSCVRRITGKWYAQLGAGRAYNFESMQQAEAKYEKLLAAEGIDPKSKWRADYPGVDTPTAAAASDTSVTIRQADRDVESEMPALDVPSFAQADAAPSMSSAAALQAYRALDASNPAALKDIVEASKALVSSGYFGSSDGHAGASSSSQQKFVGVAVPGGSSCVIQCHASAAASAGYKSRQFKFSVRGSSSFAARVRDLFEIARLGLDRAALQLNYPASEYQHLFAAGVPPLASSSSASSAAVALPRTDEAAAVGTPVDDDDAAGLQAAVDAAMVTAAAAAVASASLAPSHAPNMSSVDGAVVAPTMAVQPHSDAMLVQRIVGQVEQSGARVRRKPDFFGGDGGTADVSAAFDAAGHTDQLPKTKKSRRAGAYLTSISGSIASSSSAAAAPSSSGPSIGRVAVDALAAAAGDAGVSRSDLAKVVLPSALREEFSKAQKLINAHVPAAARQQNDDYSGSVGIEYGNLIRRPKAFADLSAFSRMAMMALAAKDPVVDLCTPKIDGANTINPWSVDGYICECCGKELANAYWHCMGCEWLRGRDFNICSACHDGRAYCYNEEKSESLEAVAKNTAMDVHRGICDIAKIGIAGKNCSCKQRTCTSCQSCSGCGCSCHTVFQLHYRFMTREDQVNMLKFLVNRVRRRLVKDPERLTLFNERYENFSISCMSNKPLYGARHLYTMHALNPPIQPAKEPWNQRRAATMKLLLERDAIIDKIAAKSGKYPVYHDIHGAGAGAGAASSGAGWNSQRAEVQTPRIVVESIEDEDDDGDAGAEQVSSAAADSSLYAASSAAAEPHAGAVTSASASGSPGAASSELIVPSESKDAVAVVGGVVAAWMPLEAPSLQAVQAALPPSVVGLVEAAVGHDVQMSVSSTANEPAGSADVERHQPGAAQPTEIDAAHSDAAAASASNGTVASSELRNTAGLVIDPVAAAAAASASTTAAPAPVSASSEGNGTEGAGDVTGPGGQTSSKRRRVDEKVSTAGACAAAASHQAAAPASVVPAPNAAASGGVSGAVGSPSLLTLAPPAGAAAAGVEQSQNGAGPAPKSGANASQHVSRGAPLQQTSLRELTQDERVQQRKRRFAQDAVASTGTGSSSAPLSGRSTASAASSGKQETRAGADAAPLPSARSSSSSASSSSANAAAHAHVTRQPTANSAAAAGGKPAVNAGSTLNSATGSTRSGPSAAAKTAGGPASQSGSGAGSSATSTTSGFPKRGATSSDYGVAARPLKIDIATVTQQSDALAVVKSLQRGGGAPAGPSSAGASTRGGAAGGGANPKHAK